MHVTAVISTTDMITFTTHLHTVPHGPRCSKNAPSFPSLLPRCIFLSLALALTVHNKQQRCIWFRHLCTPVHVKRVDARRVDSSTLIF